MTECLLVACRTVDGVRAVILVGLLSALAVGRGAGGAENERGRGGPRAVLHLRVDRGVLPTAVPKVPGQHPEADEEHFH